MTTGQRIAARRKEHNLSQEALGEALGVSRQSIYKWESDTSLPDIDKLIALSRLFGVSVGWLLGVEEESAAEPAAQWSEEQLKLVEEILRRYRAEQRQTLSDEQQAQVEAMMAEKLAAQPKSKKRRWPYVLAALLLVFAGFSLFDRLERLDNNYNNLQNSVSNINSTVNRQIGSITNRVEEILKAQNALTADYSTKFLSANATENTATFFVRVVPKTYMEGMTVSFLADAGMGVTELIGEMGPGREFSAEITCELTDSITLSAVFVYGDTRHTQVLETHEGLQSSSLPHIELRMLESVYLHEERGADGLFHLPLAQGYLSSYAISTKLLGDVSIDPDSVRVGLFKNFEPVRWLEPCARPAGWDVKSAEAFYQLPELSLALEKDDVLHFAVLFVDEYGRPGVGASVPWFVCTGEELTWESGGDATPYEDPSNYTY